MHLKGVHLSFYWATFTPEYLNMIRSSNVAGLGSFPGEIILHHTKPLSLLVKEERSQAIKDLLSVTHCIAEGFAPIGHLRRDTPTPIHRTDALD